MCDVKDCMNSDVELSYTVKDVSFEVCNECFNLHCDNSDPFTLRNIEVYGLKNEG